MKHKDKSGSELGVKLVCLKFLKTTDTLLRQADQLRRHRNEFLRTLELKASLPNVVDCRQEVSNA